jgi:hypothetical protein
MTANPLMEMMEKLIHGLSGYEHLKMDADCNVENIMTPHTPYEAANYEYSKQSVSNS